MNLLWNELLTWTNKNHMGYSFWPLTGQVAEVPRWWRSSHVTNALAHDAAVLNDSCPGRDGGDQLEEPCILVRLRTIHVYNICINIYIYMYILYRYVLWYIIYSFIPIYHISYGHIIYLWWYILYYCWATVVEGCTLDVVKCIHACICSNATIHRKVFDLCSSSNWLFYLFWVCYQNVYIYIYIYICMSVCLSVCVCVYVCACTHVYEHGDIHAHAQAHSGRPVHCCGPKCPGSRSQWPDSTPVPWPFRHPWNSSLGVEISELIRGIFRSHDPIKGCSNHPEVGRGCRSFACEWESYFKNCGTKSGTSRWIWGPTELWRCRITANTLGCHLQMPSCIEKLNFFVPPNHPF